MRCPHVFGLKIRPKTVEMPDVTLVPEAEVRLVATSS